MLPQVAEVAARVHLLGARVHLLGADNSDECAVAEGKAEVSEIKHLDF